MQKPVLNGRGVNIRHRFLVFQWDSYYPSGGFEDVTFSSDGIGEVAQYLFKSSHYDSVEVYDQFYRDFPDMSVFKPEPHHRSWEPEPPSQ